MLALINEGNNKIGDEGMQMLLTAQNAPLLKILSVGIGVLS